MLTHSHIQGLTAARRTPFRLALTATPRRLPPYHWFMPTESETPEQRAERLQQERNRAIAWISEKWKHRRCPVCDGIAWTVDNVVEVRQFEGGSFVVGGDSTIIPLIPIICDNCGYTFFVNALRAKAIVRPEGSTNA